MFWLGMLVGLFLGFYIGGFGVSIFITVSLFTVGREQHD
jgi:hypothetical protein